MDAGFLLSFLFNIFFYFSILISVSVGLTLIFGVLGILNLTHGAFYALGAYFTISIFSYFTGTSNPVLYTILLIVASFSVGVIGMLTERLLIRPVYRLAQEYQLLLTFSISLVIYDIIRYIWGVMPYLHREFFSSLGYVEIAGSIFPLYYILLIGMSLSSLLALYLLLYKTKIGLLIRAASMDKDMAIGLGINVKMLYSLVFGLGVMLAAYGGALQVPFTAITLGMGGEETNMAFAIIAIGGLGSLKGALLGAFIVSLVRALGVFYFPELELVVIYLVMFLILCVRPFGLYGKYERRV